MNISELRDLLNKTFGSLSDAQIMTLTIYGEARGEPREGKIAVGTVILERVDKHDWEGKTPKEVCLAPEQFSCFLPNDPNFSYLQHCAELWDHSIAVSAVLQDCFQVASGVLNGSIPRNPILHANKVCNYCTADAHPAWRDKMNLVAQIGHHEFFAEA